jgi:hypothetical protein
MGRDMDVWRERGSHCGFRDGYFMEGTSVSNPCCFMQELGRELLLYGYGYVFVQPH